MFYLNKTRAKIQNTKLRIERGTFFGQWKKISIFFRGYRTFKKLPKAFFANHFLAEQETSEGFFHKQLIGKALF